MTKEKMTEVLYCGHCGNKGKMSIAGEYTQTHGEEVEIEDGEKHWAYDGETIHRMVVCQSCEGIMLVRAYAFHDKVKDFTTIYPASVQYPSSVPKQVAAALNDAKSVRHASANAYGVLAARAIERICADNGCSHDKMVDNINELAVKDVIPKQLAEMAHKLRVIRNHGAHGGSTDLSEAEVPVVEAILHAIVEYIYSAPELLKTAEQLVKKLKK